LIEGPNSVDAKENVNAVRGSAEDRRCESFDSSLFRIFLSFNPSPNIVSHLTRAQNDLRHLLERTYGTELPIRWIKSFQFHLTILFFGNTSIARMNSIRARLAELVGEHPEFPCLTVQGFGCFPAYHRPRVLWIGFASNPSLRSWQDRLAKAFEGDFVGKERDRSYPHVTIARLAFQRLPARFGERLFELAQETGMPRWDWQIDSISLMRSIPEPKGAEYVALASLPSLIEND
jgi:2'-5' RNA ligase